MLTLVIVGAAVLTGAAAWKSLKAPSAPTLPPGTTTQLLGSSYVKAPPTSGFNPGSDLGLSLASQGANAGLQVGESFATNAASQGSAIAGDLAKAIPFVGAALSAIGGFLFAAHERRKAQATSENGAVNNFINDLDAMVAQITNGYNSGGLTGPQAAQYFESLWSMYWAEVTPKIQPDRNGCNGGAAIKRSKGGPAGNSACGGGSGWSAIPNKYLCSGNWGAACCVGGSVIEGTVSNLKWGVLAAEANPGKVITVQVCTIYASKYGTRARSGYNVSFKKAGS